MTTLHEATQIMAEVSNLTGLVVVTDKTLGINAEATGCYGHHLPVIRLGGDVMDGPVSIRYAVLAHEVAHHELGHTMRILPRIMERVSQVAVAVLVFTASTYLGMGEHWWDSPAGTWAMVSGAFLLWLGAILTARALDRQAEYAADSRGVELLDAAGLPGLDYMRAAVTDLTMHEVKRSRWLWILDSHPPAHRRAAALK